jgi:tetratricopeptide (TPR) repeat protein
MGLAPRERLYLGTEEEWALAEELYKSNKIRNIALFFKQVDARQLRDPGKQLEKVLSFKKRIEAGNRYLFRQYETIDQFDEAFEGYLARWQRDHEGTESRLLAGGAAVPEDVPSSAVALPNFDYWIAEARKQFDSDILDYAGALFCAQKATGAATSDIEWASGSNIGGVALSRLGRLDEAISAFTSVAERFAASVEGDPLGWQAKALFNKGVTLGALGRSEEEITVYDDLVARFGTAIELPLREQVAKALGNKGGRIVARGRGEEALAIYDDCNSLPRVSVSLDLRRQISWRVQREGHRCQATE